MHHIKLDDIANSWENLNKKKLSNKFIGLIGVLKILSNNNIKNIISRNQYIMQGKELSQWLDNLFFFGTLPQYTSTDVYWITFSLEWKKKIIPIILKNNIDLYDLAVVLLRKTPFSTNQITYEELYAKLFETYPLIQELSNAYVYDTEKNKEPIFLDTYQALDTDVKTKLESKFSTSSNESIGFEGNDKPWLIKRAGELTSAPFFQTLYAGQGVSECVIFSKFDFLKAYGFDTICSNHNEVMYKFTTTQFASLDYPFKNILFKGAPGTGKSTIIDEIIDHQLRLEKYSDNILRINIHSASSNADFMQGIGINTTNDNQIEYREKQGLIFDHIRRACYAPNQPFVLVLEEIQENSLNELIGDLIYLIEPSKRVQIQKLADDLDDGVAYPYFSSETTEEGILQRYKNKAKVDNIEFYSVKIPYLVSTHTTYREMIVPDNLYIFCTSNYRDDKKVIEDNLLRRFDVIEIYPKYSHDGIKYESDAVSHFLHYLNDSIREYFDNREVHPDRFMIGHTNWIKIHENEEADFAKALLKVFVEFKEIREIDYNRDVSKILELLLSKIDSADFEKNWAMQLLKTWNKDNTRKSYYTWMQVLQKIAYSDLLP